MPMPSDDTHLDASRRERRKFDLSRRIRRAALELFHEKGYEATTVEEIAERADVAKGTFFNHFPRKDAILLSLGEEVLDRIEDDYGPVSTWTGTVEEQIFQLFNAIADVAGRDRALTRVMLIENTRNCWMQSDPDPVELRFHNLLGAILEGGRARGELRAEVDLPAAVKLLQALHFATVVDWLRHESTTTSLAAAIATQLRLVCQGLCADGAGVPDA